MKKKLFCTVLSLMLLVSSANIFAAKFSFGVSEELNVDMGETYELGEHTMIPLRKTAEELGYEVVWSGDEMSVTVADGNVSIKIYIGEDSYFIQAADGVGMTNPVIVGAAPELKESKTYVPAVMINMLRHYSSLSKSTAQ